MSLEAGVFVNYNKPFGKSGHQGTVDSLPKCRFVACTQVSTLQITEEYSQLTKLFVVPNQTETCDILLDL